MRPRRWVLIVACCLLTVGTALLLGKRSLEKNRNLENLLIQAVTSNIKGTCNVGAVRIGFFSVYLHNVSVSMPLQAFTLNIKTIKVGIAYSKLLRYRGDVTRAINQVILIKPQLDFTLSPPTEQTADTIASPANISSHSQVFEAPVHFLFVKKGIIRLVDYSGDTLLLADNLSGKLSNKTGDVTVELDGEFGSTRKNFSLQGFFSPLKNRHHLSLRLTNAQLKHQLALKDITLLPGTINGIMECAFTNSLSPDSVELHGSLRLSSSFASIESIPAQVDSIFMNFTFEDRVCTISNCDGIFRGIRFGTKGSYVIGTQPSLQMYLFSDDVIPDSLYGILPDSLLDYTDGTMELNASLAWRYKTDPTFTITGGGLTIGTTEINRLYCGGYVSGTKLIIDSAALNADIFSANLHGFIDLDSSQKYYDVGFTISSDSLPDTIGIKGSLRVFGSVTSLGQKPLVNCRFSAHALSYHHIALGNPQLVARLLNNRCTFRSVEIDSNTSVVVSGSIDGVFSTKPEATISITVGSTPIKEQLKRIHGMPPIDSAHLLVESTGWINRFKATVDFALKTKMYDGTILAKIDRHPWDTGALIWQLHSQKAHYQDVPISFSGKGMVLDSVILIDTVSGYDGIEGKARIFYTEKPPRLIAALTYKKSVSDLLRLFPGKVEGIDSGMVSGKTALSGRFDSLKTESQIKVENFGNSDLSGFSTELSITSCVKQFTILPTTVKRDTHTVISIDTITNPDGHISFHASFSDLSPGELFGSLLPPEMDVRASLSGTLRTTRKGLPVRFVCSTPGLSLDSVHLDSIRCYGMFTERGISVSQLSFRDGQRITGHAQGFIPWAMLGENVTEQDTLRGAIQLDGDLLASIEKNIVSPIGGTGRASADIAFYVAGGNWTFTRGVVSLPEGILHVSPYVPDKVKNYSFYANIESNGIVRTDMKGTIKRKPIRIFSTHNIPDGYEPLMIGPLNFGMFQTVTTKKGVDLHMPGFMAIRDRGIIEFKGKKPFRHFTISGPIDRLKITGTWVLRDLDFTFPFLQSEELEWDFDPFPYVTWEMDLYPGNRRVMYYWDLTGKRNRIMRFVEGYLEPSSRIKVRGRDLDKTFRIYGTIRSYKGSAYYGREFNRNFDVGVEFAPQKPDKNSPYDNMPILWGSVEAFSDTSRHNRIKLTCMVADPLTGAVSEKARLADRPTPNIVFHVSSDFEEMPGKGERDYYEQAGINFTSLEGAGSMVSDFGEQMFHRYLLQKWERKIAKKLGLDVINIETSIVSNYFNKLYSRQFNGLFIEDDYLALANVGVTVGRYFFRDFLFLKARGELIPIDMALIPEYSFGFEFQANQYLTMDINYGFHKTETSIEHSPILMMQLRLPITRLRKFFKF